MEKYINDVVDSQFTDEFIKDRLKTIIPYIIDYYGTHNISTIVDALRTTTIYVCPFNVPLDKYINSILTVNIDNYYNKFLDSSLINNSNGLAYTEQPYVTYSKSSDTFVAKGNERKIIFVKEINKYNPNYKKVSEEAIDRILIHELIKRIVSAKKNNIIRGNRKINRCGLQTTYTKIKRVNSNVNLEFISESCRGISEGLIEYDTNNIFTELYGHEIKDVSYPLEVFVMKKILKNEALSTIIHEVEIGGDIVYLRSFYDRLFYNGAFDSLVKLMDELITCGYKDSKDIYDEACKKISNYLNSIELSKGVLIRER